MADWELTDEEKSQFVWRYITEFGIGQVSHVDVDGLSCAAQAKLLRWGEEECDEHTETYGARRLDCSKCRQELCRELGIE